jgi:hypothetical protein
MENVEYEELVFDEPTTMLEEVSITPHKNNKQKLKELIERISITTDNLENKIDAYLNRIHYRNDKITSKTKQYYK